MTTPLRIALEAGTKRTFASALDWPGWARAGRDEDDAIDALLAYADRYAAVLGGVRGIRFPRTIGPADVAERLHGDASTDFGVPGTIAKADIEPVDTKELARLERILRASWSAFDRSEEGARGRRLASGPRGGGRNLAKIGRHLVESDGGYVRMLGGRPEKGADRAVIRESFIDALGARARGELPDEGPRGGKRWPARYAARRTAWHALDHAWEIEDRSSA